MRQKETALKHASLAFVFLFIVWGLYRLFFQLPVETEELVIKPVIWLVPILFFLIKDKASLTSVGITFKKLFPSIYFALMLGALFAIEGLVVNYLKYQGTLTFNANIGELPFFYSFGLSVATAIPEEIVFRGFIFNRIWYALKNEWSANIISSILWGAMHLPVAIFALHMGPGALLGYIFLTVIYGIGAAFVFAKTKNIIAPILLHVLWEAPIILFR